MTDGYTIQNRIELIADMREKIKTFQTHIYYNEENIKRLERLNDEEIKKPPQSRRQTMTVNIRTRY